jgi:hypothetical protein
MTGPGDLEYPEGRRFRLLRDVTAGYLAMDSDEPGAGYRQDDVIGPAGTTVEATGEWDASCVEVRDFANDEYAVGYVAPDDLAPLS